MRLDVIAALGCQVAVPGPVGTVVAPPQDPAAEPSQATVQEEHLEQRRHDVPAHALEPDAATGAGYMLLEWGGLRERIEDAGLHVDVFFTSDFSHAASGGGDPGGNALRSLLDVAFTLDTERSFGHEGGTLFADVEWIAGVDGSREFGVLQAFSNIDAEHRFQVSRAWYEQRFESGTLARIGKMDANAQFAYVDAGAGFLHSSMGFSPTIFGLPTYPDPAFGLVLGQRMTAGLEARAGVFDGAAAQGIPTGSRGPSTLFGDPGDLFVIAELDLAWDAGRAGRAGIGGWYHSGDLERFDGGVEDGTQGAYLVLEQGLWSDFASEGRALSAFLQLGVADDAVSPFATHVGAGLVWARPFSERLDDALGLGVSSVGLSDEPAADFSADHETAIELYWGFEPLPWLRVKPDIQYVIDPGGDTNRDDLLVLTLRTTMSL